MARLIPARFGRVFLQHARTRDNSKSHQMGCVSSNAVCAVAPAPRALVTLRTQRQRTVEVLRGTPFLLHFSEQELDTIAGEFREKAFEASGPAGPPQPEPAAAAAARPTPSRAAQPGHHRDGQARERLLHHD
jgi:hypothetical protein